MTVRSVVSRITVIAVAMVAASALTVFAVSNGRIDAKNKGQHYASFLTNPGIDASTNDLRINFGKFSTQPERNIRITDEGMTGFAWGALSGWIVMNCADTASGCSATNGNFKVSVDEEGLLSGFAWGENTGWINFGPFTNTAISRVQIDDQGYFDGSSSYAGFAWSENFGWIVFDCDAGNESCVRTDYTLTGNRPVQQSSGSTTQCADNIDNDGDGLEDLADPQCGNGSMTEFAPYVPPTDLPVVPGPVVPIAPSTPRTPSGTPGTAPNAPIDTTPNEPWIDIPLPSIPDTIIGEVIPIVTDVVTGESTLAQAWERLKDMVRELVTWVKDFFDVLTSAIEDLMSGARAKEFMKELSVVGIGLFAIAALFLAAIVPIAGGADLFLYPTFILHNMLVSLGILATKKPWGVLYDTATFQPLVHTQVNLVDASGKVVARTLSHPDGSFAFRTSSGLYKIEVAGAAGTMDPHAKALFGPLYNPGEMIGVADNIPSHPFSLGVASAPQAPLSRLQRFVMSHEVLITNVSLTLFGIGIFAAVLSVIFAPSALTVGIIGVYGVVIVLRGAGAIGSYASVFIDRVSNLPAAGKLVQVFSADTKEEVARTLTSRFGRAYFNIPEGHYYSVVSDPGAIPEGQSAPIGGTTTPEFISRGGLHRAHIEI